MKKVKKSLKKLHFVIIEVQRLNFWQLKKRMWIMLNTGHLKYIQRLKILMQANIQRMLRLQKELIKKLSLKKITEHQNVEEKMITFQRKVL